MAQDSDKTSDRMMRKSKAPAGKRKGFMTARGEAMVRSEGPALVSQSLEAGFAMRLIDAQGKVDVDRVAEVFRMSKGQLAETIGLATATVSKAERQAAQKTQRRLTEMVEIIGRIRGWAGGEAQALAWYRSQPIPALDGRTPEALVKDGRASAVREYLDHIALGGFA